METNKEQAWNGNTIDLLTDLIPYFNVSDQSDCSIRGDLFHLLHLPVHLLQENKKISNEIKRM